MQKQPEQKLSESYHKKKAQKIIDKCLWQNKIFHNQATQKNWKAIHSSHYDWWAFPINERSSYGQEFKVSYLEISIMKNSVNFLMALSENAIIVCKSWGWDLVNGEMIKTDDPDQKWQDWPIRLYKMTKSLDIFGLYGLFKNAVKYGIEIMKTRRHLQYGRRNISAYMNQKWQEILLDQEKKSKEKVKQSAELKKQTETQKEIIYEKATTSTECKHFSKSYL